MAGSESPETSECPLRGYDCHRLGRKFLTTQPGRSVATRMNQLTGFVLECILGSLVHACTAGENGLAAAYFGHAVSCMTSISDGSVSEEQFTHGRVYKQKHTV